MFSISPTTRITIGLVLIMMSLVLVGDMIGLIPDRAKAVREGRSALAETLAVQFSISAQKRENSAIKASMRSLVQRNDDVLSAALKETSGRVIAVAGDHNKYWKVSGEQSTPDNIRVPIHQGIKEWGTVEISFVPLHETGAFGISIPPLVRISAYIMVAGFIAFLFFIKKTHRHIDPTTVVPSRVTNALNALAEGVFLLDTKGQIMLANNAISETLDKKPEELIGKKASDFGWEFTNSYESEFPWVAAIRTGEVQTGKQLFLANKSGEQHTFMVNSSPVKDSDGVNRGALATFDDVTQLEEKNDELQNMLGLLKTSRDEVKRQNNELQILATRDSLTNCLNRRSFFEKYKLEFTAARKNDEPLACIMTDIDFFKSINDRYGHAMGDQVIVLIADELQKSMRSSDMICRYGGEEFCIILSGAEVQDAVSAAERARVNIETASIPDEDVISVTSSFGIAYLDEDTESLAQLIDNADKALYVSKNNGRNRVTVWDRLAEENKTGLVKTGTTNNLEPVNHALKSATAPIDGTETSESNEYMTSRPEHDSLTGLPNRRSFHDSIENSVALCDKQEKYMAVMMLDLNMFKRINNALGYKVGDKLLTTVSNRLLETLRKTDSISRMNIDESTTSIYRLGGDEFGILLTEMDSGEFTELVVKRIIDAIVEPLEIDNHEIHMSCSIGISTFPGGSPDVDTLLDNAGMALFYAKRQGKNTFQFYDDQLTNASLENLKLENDLRHAVERDELELHYQPKIELHSGKIIGMEALLRWNHPELGMISPVEFIPLAEQSGLITKIGKWALHTACSKNKEWKSVGYKNISVAVNLSAVQFRQKDILQMVRDIIVDTGIDPNLLELEITESTIMDDVDKASETMRELHGEGVRISIDDFGTGYSSLSHLKRFPLNTVKIDRSFVRDLTTDPDDAAIVGAIIAMAHSMGLKIVAEGVETKQQLDYLRRLRCDEIQGFLFSKPLSGDEAEELLKLDHEGDAFSGTLTKIAS